MLGYLATRSEQPVDRETLHREVWGYRATVVSRALDTTVRRLRLKIESDPSKPMHLITVHGMGYQWVRAFAQPLPAPSPIAHTLEQVVNRELPTMAQGDNETMILDVKKGFSRKMSYMAKNQKVSVTWLIPN